MAMLSIPSYKTDDPNYRYKMPRLVAKVEGRGNGIRTNIVNMGDIARALKRPPDYPTKFCGTELGAQSKFDPAEGKAIVNGAHEQKDLQILIDKFIEKFVLCHNCNLPEIDLLVKKNRVQYQCNACGNKSDVDNAHKLASFIIKNPPGIAASTMGAVNKKKLAQSQGISGTTHQNVLKNNYNLNMSLNSMSNDSQINIPDMNYLCYNQNKNQGAEGDEYQNNIENHGKKSSNSSKHCDRYDDQYGSYRDNSSLDKEDSNGKKQKSRKSKKDKTKKSSHSSRNSANFKASNENSNENEKDDSFNTEDDDQDNFSSGTEQSHVALKDKNTTKHESKSEKTKLGRNCKNLLLSSSSTGDNSSKELLTGLEALNYSSEETQRCINELIDFVCSIETSTDATEESTPQEYEINEDKISPTSFFDQLRLFQVAMSFDHTIKFYIALETLFSAKLKGLTAQSLEERIKYLKVVAHHTDSFDILTALSDFLYLRQETSVIPEGYTAFSAILYSFYDNELLSDESIKKYYTSESILKKLPCHHDKTIEAYLKGREAAKPIIEWFNEDDEK